MGPRYETGISIDCRPVGGNKIEAIDKKAR